MSTLTGLFHAYTYVSMGGPASSTTAEIYMQAYERTAITTALHPPKVWEQFVDDVYSILKRTHLENFFHHINNLHQNIKFTMEEESNGELAFLDTLLKRNNGEISVLVYRKPTHTDQNLHYSSHHQTSCKESVLSSLFNTAYSIITNKDDLHKENAIIKQVLTLFKMAGGAKESPYHFFPCNFYKRRN